MTLAEFVAAWPKMVVMEAGQMSWLTIRTGDRPPATGWYVWTGTLWLRIINPPPPPEGRKVS